MRGIIERHKCVERAFEVKCNDYKSPITCIKEAFPT